MLARLRPLLFAAVMACALTGIATAVDLFDELRGFAGTVLVPPDGLAPFAELRPYRVEIGRVRGTGPARGRYLIQYREGESRSLDAGQAQIAGTIGREEFDEAVEALANLSFRRCDADAAYCTENVGGHDGAAPASELFRGLSVDDGPAIVEHVTCCGGHNWTLTWFDPARDMTYELVLLGPRADAYGTEITPENLASARAIAELAARLEPLR